MSKKKNPLVSVIITCHNYGEFLSDCLSSLINQDYKNLECILINDASQDNTEEIAHRFIDSMPLKYSYEENLSASKSRNSGLKLAMGEYIQILDADDTLMPGKIQEQVRILSKEPMIDLVYSDAIVNHFEGKKVDFNTPKCDSWNKEFMYQLLKNPFTINSPLIRASFFRDVGYFDESIRSNEDWELWLRGYLRGKKYKYISTTNSNALVHIHSRNHTSNNAWLVFKYRLKIRDRLNYQLKSTLLKEHNQQLAKYEIDYLANVALDNFRDKRRFTAFKQFLYLLGVRFEARYLIYMFSSLIMPRRLIDTLVGISFRSR